MKINTYHLNKCIEEKSRESDSNTRPTEINSCFYPLQSVALPSELSRAYPKLPPPNIPPPNIQPPYPQQSTILFKI